MERIRGIILFLDFDGTLSPIVDDPMGAAIPDKIYTWLKKLSRKRGIKIGIVTGRSMQDIRKRVAQGQFEFSQHAVDQSIIRRISVQEIREAIAVGEVIEVYPEDKYGPVA